MVVDHPDDAYTVLNSKSCMEKAFVYRFFNMGASLFTAPGACKLQPKLRGFIKWLFKSMFVIKKFIIVLNWKWHSVLEKKAAIKKMLILLQEDRKK